MKIKKLVVGPVATNCYLVYNVDTKEALIIDPGAQAGRIKKQIRETGCKPVAILLTHGHFDHIMAAEELKESYQILVYAHRAEKNLAADADLNAARTFGTVCELKIDRLLEDDEELNIAGFQIRVLFTPGHTQGGVCYYFPEEQVLFSGDTLFAESVGRTDLPTGSSGALMRSVREKLMPLPDETKVFPGHMEETSIGYERMHNPFISL